MSLSVKICGIKNIESALTAQEYGADYLGFVFFDKSPRNISPANCSKIISKLSPEIKNVVVTVNAAESELDNIFDSFKPNYVQCHGNESIDRIEQIKKRYNTKIIKAFLVRDADDIAASFDYQDVVDIILFDAKAPKSEIPGGNGLSFDWNLLKNRKFDFQWMLSGGLNFTNLDEAIKTTNAKMIDLSSAVESSPGVKDNNLIKEFLQKAKNI